MILSRETIWLIILGAPLLLAAWFAIFTRWRRGIEFLVLYMPFAGAISLWMAPNPAPLLFKDFLFVIPLYLTFALVSTSDISRARIPPAVVALIAVFAAIVLLQVFNPNIAKPIIGAIGAKVWLFYMPMIFIGGAMVRGVDDVVRLLRLIVAVAVVPATVGLVQFSLANIVGYETAIELFYGAAAEAATQGYSQFDYGAALYRIPSTFTFVAQYGGFCLAMIPAAYALSRLDPSRWWRSFARAVLGLIVVAGLLSGSRGNIVFIPLLLVLIYMADARMSGLLAVVFLLPTFVLAVFWTAGYDLLAIFGISETLMTGYGSGVVLPSIVESVQKFPMGIGTGMNTGPARHAFSLAEQDRFVGYESFYAKAVVELGIPGLLILVALFGTLAYYGLRAHARVRDRRLKSCSAALLAFLVIMMIHSLKGWQVDLDPVNVYFWLYAGILLKLPRIVPEPAHETATPDSTIAARLRRGGGSIRWSSRARPRA